MEDPVHPPAFSPVIFELGIDPFWSSLDIVGLYEDAVQVSGLLVLRIQVVGEKLVHCEHVHLVLLEDRVHRVIATNLALVVGIL